MVNETQLLAAGACVLIVVVVACGLFGGAFAVLGPTSYGLDLNSVTKTVDESKVFTSGRYFLGLGHSFLEFPRELQIIDFSSDPDSGGPVLRAGTADGQAVTLEVTVYYQLEQASVVDLYRLYNLDYNQAFVRIAQAELKNVAVQFDTDAYFSRRADIANRMLNDVAKALRDVHATTQFVLLRNIGLPSSIETSLVAKIVAEQEKRTARFNREIAFVNAQTEVIRATANANITQINGEAKADANLIKEKGRAEGTQLVLRAEQEALGALQRELGFDTDQLYRYLWATRKLRVAPAKDTLIVGFDGANTLLNVAAAGGTAK